MKNSKVLCAATITAVCAAAANAEVSSNMALTTDYVFRGLSQTLEDPAIQAGVDYVSASGWYVGTWASNVDFTESPPDDDASVEWDLYLGYSSTFANEWSWDLSYIYYAYPGTASGVDLDYGEVLFNIGFGDYVSALLGYSNDVFNSNEDGTYLNVGGEWPLGNLSLSGEVGYYDLKNQDYTHWSLGLSKTFGNNYTADVRYHDTDDDIDFGDIADSRVVFTISAEF